jgi:hypothetical protein
MPVHGTRGAASVEGFGFGAAAAVPVYVENVFSTYLYKGTGATQTITNNIPESTSGAMTWIKSRSATGYQYLFDTVQGATKYTSWNGTTPYGQLTDSTSITSFNTNGFSLGTGSTALVNSSGTTYASWTFAKQPNFFDIQTYTGNGTAGNTISHNLGSTPGCIIVVPLNAAYDPIVYHNGMNGGVNPQNYYMYLDYSNAQAASATFWNNTAPTSTNFTLGNSPYINGSGKTFAAYLFASNAGGFGLTGTDNVITCGSYTGTGSSVNTITLGYEPQWILIKNTSGSGTSWVIEDTMRQMSNTDSYYLLADTSDAETDVGSPAIVPTATGFKLTVSGSFFNATGNNYIYIAIRRGPMAVPTDPTKVFVPVKQTPSGATTITTNFPVDLSVPSQLSQATQQSTNFLDRLRGETKSTAHVLFSNTTDSEYTDNVGGFGFDSNISVVDNWMNTSDGVTSSTIYWNFRRAPSFFDEVCYTGTGSNTTQPHNLGVVPQMIIVKSRGSVTNWYVYHSGLTSATYALKINTIDPQASAPTAWNSTTPTSSVFSLGTSTAVNGSATNYVAYLFATCSGVSKVGSYTGTGATQSIACGFGAGGARFILAKRIDSTGDWYCWDSANGLTSSSSPYMLWDTTAAQTTGNNGTYASSGGFTLTSASPVNTSGGSFIFLAIA